MARPVRRVLGMMFCVASASLACAKKANTTVENAKPETPTTVSAPASPTPTPSSPGAEAERLATAYFDFNRSDLRDDARGTLKHDGELLRSSGASVRIEGHCDERGSTQYNLALGERRANAARDYLVRLGVDAGHVETVSYGKERPADPGHDESAWARNRRVELLVTGGGQRVSSSY